VGLKMVKDWDHRDGETPYEDLAADIHEWLKHFEPFHVTFQTHIRPCRLRFFTYCSAFHLFSLTGQ